MKNHKKSQEKERQIQDKSRRKAVKKLAGGVTALAAYQFLPARWDKPILEQIFLPAHAQTSGATCSGCSLEDPCTITIVSGNPSSSEVVVRVNGKVVPPLPGLQTTITVTPEGAGIAPPVFSTTTDAQGNFGGTITITGGPGITAVSAVTKVDGADPAGCSTSTRVESNPTTTQAPGSNPTTTQAPGSTTTQPPPTTTSAPTTTPPAGVLLELGRVVIRQSVFGADQWDYVHAVITTPSPTPPTTNWRVTLYRESGAVLLTRTTGYSTNSNWIYSFLKTAVNPGEQIRMEIVAIDAADTVTGSPKTATVPNT